ncbi:uncharacterized protein LOC123663759 [Melitaea cinxia]|uniref:uncharacterized protein LOC123663759 n=1 Tax=Melitaea cinxia TaxID=113334 RepID=UPI001E27149B|nr:uncharacterized protein LOC123663759 [Melitaea cinxia]
MELSLVLLALSMFFKMSSSVRCYKCEPEQKYDGSSLCRDFDGSDRFLEDCKHSTMCFKRETTLRFADGITTSTVQRGCASQTLDGDQAKINGKWQHVDTIYEVYDEGCTENVDPDRPTVTVNCYCRGHLCNGANIEIINYKTILLLIIAYIFS